MMKRLGILFSVIGLLGIFISENSFAEALSSDEMRSKLDAESSIVNLVYYPHVGKFLIAPQFTIPLSDGTTTSQRGTTVGNTSINYYEMALTAQVGLITDGLRLIFTESELIYRQNTAINAITNVKTVTSSGGLSDPTLQLQYRVFRSNPSEWFGDVGMSASPSLITHQVASSLQDGNNGKGYGTLAAHGTLFWVYRTIETELQATMTRLFSGNGNGSVAANSYNRTATWNESFAVYERIHLTADLFFQVQGDFNLPFSYSQTSFKPATSNYHVPFYMVPHFSLGYLINDHFLVDAGFTYTGYTTLIDGPTASTSILNSDTAFALRTRIQF